MTILEKLHVLRNSRLIAENFTEEAVTAAYVEAVVAMEKQIPKKIDFEINLGDRTSRFICGCGKRIVVDHDRGVMDNNNAPDYCPNCGQRLDWIG